MAIFGFVERFNPKIKQAQNCLYNAEFSPGQIDGRIGWQTRKAIEDFQKANQLKITGYIDSQTWVKLRNYQQTDQSVSVALNYREEVEKEPPKESAVSAEQKERNTIEVIKLRLKSIDGVKEIQTALKDAGVDTGPIDGKVGPKTKKAITDFQKSKNLNVDGVIGPKTWEKLSAYFPKD